MAKAPKTSLPKVPLAKAKATPKKGSVDAKKPTPKGGKCPTCGRSY